jgi:ComF family protein
MQLQKALNVLFPGQCVACGDLVEEAHALCGACWSETPFIDGLVCDVCGQPLLGEGDGSRPLCDDCMAHPRAWSRGRAALIYRGRARRMVLALKHGDRPDIAKPAARWMAPRAQELLPPDGLIVPVPLHWTRLLKRRFNQAALLARGIGGITRHEVLADGLARRRRTGSQENRNRDERALNVAGSMIAHPGRTHLLEGRSILVIDDVMTSGATFAEAAKALLAAGAAEVSVLALARVVKDG